MYWSSQAWAFSDGLPSQVPCIPVPAVQVQYHVQAAAQFTKLPSPASVPAGIMLLLLANRPCCPTPRAPPRHPINNAVQQGWLKMTIDTAQQ